MTRAATTWTIAALLGLAAPWLLRPAPASACASCACGDPTLTQMGTEQAFAGRLRLSLDGQGRTDAFGAGAERQRLRELRLALSGSWSPTRAFTLYATVPLVARSLQHANLSEERALGLGDVELRGRFTLWRDRAFQPEHMAGGWLGFRFPTAPELAEGGRPLSHDAQTGAGSWVPLGGLWYAHFAYPWMLYGSVALELPIGGWGRMDNAEQLFVTLAGQRQLSEAVALRLAAEWRWAGRDEMNGMVDPESGGWVGFLTPALTWAFAEDWQTQLQVRLPVVSGLRGAHEEGPTVLANVLADFDLGGGS